MKTVAIRIPNRISMEKATSTADLTETEKYLNRPNYASSDSGSDTEEVAQDTLLGGIRSGLSTITGTARKALSTCKNIAELDDATQRIEEASLKLLKLERSFLKSASIVSDVIEDMASDFEDDDESLQTCLREEVDNRESSGFAYGAGDASSHARQQPYIFRVSEKNVESVMNFKEKLSEEFNKRLGAYKGTLTDSHLKKDKKFKALLDQIKLGKNDANTSMKKCSDSVAEERERDDDTEKALSKQSSLSAFLSSIPFTTDEMTNYHYEPYNEDDDMDHSVLPATDPITRNPICLPLKNKYCNHVFDRDSIYNYIDSNPTSTCPIHMCRNKKALEKADFVFDSVLNSHVRRKNHFE